MDKIYEPPALLHTGLDNTGATGVETLCPGSFSAALSGTLSERLGRS